MSATNSTPTINLPLFIGTDKPAWLTDWNGAMNAIDSAIATLQTAESGTATALAALSQSVTALSGTVETHTTALQTLTTAVSGNTGSINTINSLIGNGQPTTEDKTIIGAINEIYGEIGGGDGMDASEVAYSNTSSGLTATDVQAAIDEVNGKIPSITTPDAEDVSYDNTSSGLTATNVQAALDELAQGGGSTETETNYTGATLADVAIPDKFYFKYKSSANVFITSPVFKKADLVASGFVVIGTLFVSASNNTAAWVGISSDGTKFMNGQAAHDGTSGVGTNDTYTLVSIQ